jgi:hypothetical protein
MVCIQLNLAGAVEEYVVLTKLLQALQKPVEVCLELLQRVQHAAIGSEVVIFHHLLQLDEVSYVDCALVTRVVIRRVEVHDGAGASNCPEKLVHWQSQLRAFGCRNIPEQGTLLPSQYVDLPAPGLPRTSCAKGIL